MAAASSMTSSSAWPSFTASPGWMYCWSHEREGQICSFSIVNNGKRSGFVYLNGLPMLFEDVHTHHSFVELRIQRLDDFIVKMLLQTQKKDMKRFLVTAWTYYRWYREDSQAEYLILQSIKAFEDEFKHGMEVVRARGSYKDIGVAVKNVKQSLAKMSHYNGQNWYVCMRL